MGRRGLDDDDNDAISFSYSLSHQGCRQFTHCVQDDKGIEFGGFLQLTPPHIQMESCTLCCMVSHVDRKDKVNDTPYMEG